MLSFDDMYSNTDFKVVPSLYRCLFHTSPSLSFLLETKTNVG